MAGESLTAFELREKSLDVMDRRGFWWCEDGRKEGWGWDGGR
jgi:hypothetical protein